MFKTPFRRFVPTLAALSALATAAMFAPSPALAAPHHPGFPTVTAPKAPAFIGGAGDWLNTGGKARTVGGHVTLVTFWTTGCINCKRVLPYWSGWYKKYAGDVDVLAVHTPETPRERSPRVVARFAKERGLTFPILMDSDAKNWNAFGIASWPTTILIDKQGRIRNRWEGELNWQNAGTFREVEREIEALRVDKP